MTTFLKVPEIESALVALNKAYPGITQLITLPNVTAEGRTSHALVIRDGGYRCRSALIFISGAHAREWGGPDILVDLAADVLEAYTSNAGLTYLGKAFSAAEVRSIVRQTTIVVFPDINPDGRAFSMAFIPRRAASRSSLSYRSRIISAGTTCQETPKRSFSQPHGPGSPPSAVRSSQ